MLLLWLLLLLLLLLWTAGWCCCYRATGMTAALVLLLLLPLLVEQCQAALLLLLPLLLLLECQLLKQPFLEITPSKKMTARSETRPSRPLHASQAIPEAAGATEARNVQIGVLSVWVHCRPLGSNQRLDL